MNSLPSLPESVLCYRMYTGIISLHIAVRGVFEFTSGGCGILAVLGMLQKLVNYLIIFHLVIAISVGIAGVIVGTIHSIPIGTDIVEDIFENVLNA